MEGGREEGDEGKRGGWAGVWLNRCEEDWDNRLCSL